MYASMVKQRPLEQGIFGALRRIDVPRPPGAARAFALAAADVHELSAAIAEYGSVSKTTFEHDYLAWSTDNRANLAFAAIGARSCG
jgi:hypothetical protein